MRTDLLSLDAIRDKVGRGASQLRPLDAELPTFGQSDHTGRPHVEVRDTYDWVVCERGSELERRKTLQIDELLYWIFKSATFNLAMEWELQNRVRGQDFRRLLFQHQHELLTKLKPEWAARHDEELSLVLRDHPLDDSL